MTIYRIDENFLIKVFAANTFYLLVLVAYASVVADEKLSIY